VPVSSRGLALLAITGLAIALTSCSSAGSTTTAASGASASGTAAASSAASTAPPTAAASASASASVAVAVPAGYVRIGGAEQGISVAVPGSWVVVNPDQNSIDAGANKLKVAGLSATTVSQDLSELQKVHGVIAVDVASAVADHGKFARTINAYCSESGVTDTGSAGVPLIKAGAKDEIGAIGSHITQQDAEIGGVPGVQTSYQLKSATIGTLYGSQLEVLPKPSVACFVTLSAITPQQLSLLAVAAKTAQFP
jgi:hypothetical protein